MKISKVVILILAVFGMLTVAADHHRQISGKVLHVSEEFGNIDTDLELAEIGELGMTKGESFTVAFGEHEFQVYFGDSYSDVPRGEWVAFVTEMGNLRIARNFDNASATLGVKLGDTITLYH